MAIRIESNFAEHNNVTVSVNVIHSPKHSKPGQLFYVYFITIHNVGLNTVQLLSRHWEITDSTGTLQIVDGEGVIGQQPTFAPDEQFVYNSGVPIRNAPGSMHGHYTFASDTGEQFQVLIPEFMLLEPNNESHLLNRILN